MGVFAAKTPWLGNGIYFNGVAPLPASVVRGVTANGNNTAGVFIYAAADNAVTITASQFENNGWYGVFVGADKNPPLGNITIGGSATTGAGPGGANTSSNTFQDNGRVGICVNSAGGTVATQLNAQGNVFSSTAGFPDLGATASSVTCTGTLVTSPNLTFHKNCTSATGQAVSDNLNSAINIGACLGTAK